MSLESAGMLQVAIGVALIAAAASKIVYRTSLAPFLVASGLARRWAVFLSRVMPIVEGMLGSLLILDTVALPVALVAALLTLGFSGSLFYAYQRGVQEPCRCYGALDTDHLSIAAVGRATTLAVAALALVAVDAGGKTIMTSSIWSISSMSGVVGVLTGVAYVAIFALLEQVSSFERGRQSFLKPREQPSVVEWQ